MKCVLDLRLLHPVAPLNVRSVERKFPQLLTLVLAVAQQPAQRGQHRRVFLVLRRRLVHQLLPKLQVSNG